MPIGKMHRQHKGLNPELAGNLKLSFVEFFLISMLNLEALVACSIRAVILEDDQLEPKGLPICGPGESKFCNEHPQYAIVWSSFAAVVATNFSLANR